MKNSTKTSTKKQKLQSHTALQQFLQKAAAYKLSAGAILLWQSVYFAAQRKGKYSNVVLCTADLIATLGITRNGLQKIRRMLTEAGLLEVRVDARKNVYYTLMIDGEVVHETGGGSETEKAAKSKTKMTNSHGEEQTAGCGTGGGFCGTGNPSPTMATGDPRGMQGTASPAVTTDILQNNAYRKLVDAFCTQYDSGGVTALSTRLQQFLYRRKQQGKTLTRAGLDALLGKLCTLAQENVQTMICIIEQSMQRGWYGFYPYRALACNVSAGSGKVRGIPHEKPSRIPKYDTKKEDLDFLEW